MATNNEFLIDHRNPMDEDMEDHSQFKPTAITPEKNVLLGGEQATSVADGTFLVDDEEQHHHHHEQQQQQQHSDEYPPHQQCDGDDDISVRPNAPVAEVEAAAAVVDTGRNSQPHSSSIDDFEFIATPPTTTEHREQVKMDNLLDFDAAPTATATAPPAGNLVETLLTGEDLKPHKEAAAAYLENEFTQLTGGSQQPQDFNFVSAKPIKDVYNDFMEAERGGRVDLMHDEPHHREPSPEPLPVKKPAVEEEEKPIETISSAPFIPTAAEITTSKKEYISDDDEDDLLEDFAPAAPAPAPAMRPQQPVPEPEPIVKHEEVKVVEQKEEEVKKNVVIYEKKEEPVVELPVKHVEPAVVPEPVVIKPKPVEVEVPKAAPISTPAAAAVQPQPQQAKKQPAKKDELITTSAEEMFCKFGLDAWFNPERLHPKVESLIYWRDVKKSGIVCGAGLVILLAMSLFSVISVFAYVSLLLLGGTVAFRIYKSVMQALQKTTEGHPFKAFLDFELQLPQEKVQQVTGVAVSHINSVLAELRRLFLVEDLVDSIKFGLMLYCLTYVGAWFNGMTLVILSYVALFTLPKVYETNKQSIDAYLDVVRSKINEITEKVKAAIPIGKKTESDKEK